MFFDWFKKDDTSEVKNTNNNHNELQRRDFFRFICVMDMKFSVIHNSEHTLIHNAIIKDISAGGIKFITNINLDLEQLIECNIMLNTTTILAKGKVLEKQYVSETIMKFQYRVLFLDMSRNTQDIIMHYIFTEQKKRNKVNDKKYKRIQTIE